MVRWISYIHCSFGSFRRLVGQLRSVQVVFSCPPWPTSCWYARYGKGDEFGCDMDTRWSWSCLVLLWVQWSPYTFFWGSYRRNIQGFVKHIPSLKFYIIKHPKIAVFERRYMSQKTSFSVSILNFRGMTVLLHYFEGIRNFDGLRKSRETY